MRFAPKLVALLGICAAHSGIAAPDPQVADAAVRAFMAREGIPAAHITVLSGDDVVLQRNGNGKDSSNIRRSTRYS